MLIWGPGEKEIGVKLASKDSRGNSSLSKRSLETNLWSKENNMSTENFQKFQQMIWAERKHRFEGFLRFSWLHHSAWAHLFSFFWCLASDEFLNFHLTVFSEFSHQITDYAVWLNL